MASREQPRRAVLIANPVSGGGSGHALAEKAMAGLGRRRVPVQLRYTQSPGDAERLAREAVAEGADLLLALGGDGTIRDVAVGLGDSGIPLAILPAGTGNDLIRTLRLPIDIEAALDVALQGRERSLDLWLWNQRPFLNVACFGLDAATAEVVNTRLHALRGALAYIVGLLMTLPSYQPLPLTLRWECRGEAGEWNGRSWLCAFANGRYYGGGMKIAPDAEPDDGLLDIVIVEDVSKLELLQQLPGLFPGNHVKHPRVRQIRADRVEVTAPPHVVSLDGELYEGPPAVLTRAPYSILVRAPHLGEVPRSIRD